MGLGLGVGVGVVVRVRGGLVDHLVRVRVRVRG